MTDLSNKLSDADRDQSFANVTPRDAATLILIDRSGLTPKVLLGRRHHGHVFMPGKFVFPGGRVEPQDRSMPVAANLHPHTTAKLTAGSPATTATKARALALAAVRETFEETGIVLGRKSSGSGAVPQGPWAEFVQTGFLPDLTNLHFVGRAVTPPRRPRRFDTRFFTVDAQDIGHRLENVVHAEAELVELAWVPVGEARRLKDLPTITGVILEELQARVEAGFARDLPVPFYKMRNGRFRREVI